MRSAPRSCLHVEYQTNASIWFSSLQSILQKIAKCGEIHAQKLNGLLIASSISPVDENRRYLESDITIKKLEVQSENGRKR